MAGFNKVDQNAESAEVKPSINPVEQAIEIAIKVCKHFEGFRAKPYLCPAGYPTIGYGTVFKPDGTAVKLTDPAITEEQAYEWLKLTLQRDYMTAVLQQSPNLIKYPGTLGAITSFIYNLGIARYKASTLKRRINANDWAGAKIEIKKWNKAVVKGQRVVLKGLQLRREAEASYIGT